MATKRHRVGKGKKQPAYCVRINYDFQGGPLRQEVLFLSSKGRVVNAIDFPKGWSLAQIREEMKKYDAREVPCSRVRTAKETPFNR
jgi:hypothetical protein